MCFLVGQLMMIIMRSGTGVVRKTERGRAECKAELSFLASSVRDAGAAERHRWEELSRCVTETHRTRAHAQRLDVYSYTLRPLGLQR